MHELFNNINLTIYPKKKKLLAIQHQNSRCNSTAFTFFIVILLHLYLRWSEIWSNSLKNQKNLRIS